MEIKQLSVAIVKNFVMEIKEITLSTWKSPLVIGMGDIKNFMSPSRESNYHNNRYYHDITVTVL